MDYFRVFDIETQTLLLRLLNALVILLVSLELFRAANLIKNERATRIVWKFALLVFGFFVARLLAGLVDSWVGYTIGWFSNVVNVAFWTHVLIKCSRFRRILAKESSNPARERIRKALDEILDQLDEAKANLRIAEINMQSKLTK